MSEASGASRAVEITRRAHRRSARARRSRRGGLILLALLAVGAGGCFEDIDPPWQLDHDRIVAVRASPPGVASGEQATLDALAGYQGALTAEVEPEAVQVIAPMGAEDLLTLDAGTWVVTAPDQARLAEMRAGYGLPADAPVPLQLGLLFDGDLAALKVVNLGVHADNPGMGAITIDGGEPEADDEIVVGREIDVPMAVEVAETDDVNWLTSVGTMHDFDLPEAYLVVEPDNPLDQGELAVVVRDGLGGVAWQVWPIRVE
jgi:hypothetical protein